MASVDWSGEITVVRLLDLWVTSDRYTVDHCWPPDWAGACSGLVYDDDEEALPVETSCLKEDMLYCSEMSLEVTPDPG